MIDEGQDLEREKYPNHIMNRKAAEESERDRDQDQDHEIGAKDPDQENVNVPDRDPKIGKKDLDHDPEIGKEGQDPDLVRRNQVGKTVKGLEIARGLDLGQKIVAEDPDQENANVHDQDQKIGTNVNGPDLEIIKDDPDQDQGTENLRNQAEKDKDVNLPLPQRLHLIRVPL